MIADMHCDTLGRIRENRKQGRNSSLRDDEELRVNLKKMRQGNYTVQNFAVFIDSKDEQDPYENAMELVNLFHAEMGKNQDLVQPVTSVDEIENNQKEGKLSALLTLEEGGMCKGEVEKLREFYCHGARMLGLCWNHENELGYPAEMEWKAGKCSETMSSGTDADNRFGLKKRGFEFLEEMEHIGMIPDVSHLSDAGFFDVADFCKKPFVASHSNARSVYGHYRNLTDEMLHKLGNCGGVVGLNYYPVILGENMKQEQCLEAAVKHVCHMIQNAGSESVGLGSDFDGFGESSAPADSAACDLLAWELHKVGLTERQIDGILYRNVMRIYREILK